MILNDSHNCIATLASTADCQEGEVNTRAFAPILFNYSRWISIRFTWGNRWYEKRLWRVMSSEQIASFNLLLTGITDLTHTCRNCTGVLA